MPEVERKIILVLDIGKQTEAGRLRLGLLGNGLQERKLRKIMGLLEKNRVIDQLRLVRGKMTGRKRGRGAVLVGIFHVLSKG